jgi:hypothetical protein
MRPLLLVPLLAALTGCAATVKEFRAPDGSAVKTVKCSSDSAKCFAAASESCPDGGTYRVLGSASRAGGLAADLIPGPITWYYMSYVCGPSDGTMPDFPFTGSQYVPPAYTPPTTTRCTTIGSTTTCRTQ